MSARSVKEWVGATPESKPPPRVLLRIFQRENGTCYLTGRKIMPGEEWDADHKIALINGGKNCESNLFPALTAAHKDKTREDLVEKARVAKQAKNHVLPRRPKQSLKSGNSLKGPERAHEGRGPAVGLSEIARRFGFK